MRDLAAATVLVIVIAVGALAPALWQPRFEGQALASTAVSPTASPMPPSWKGKDRGSGFVVCAKNDSWSRPTVAEENAHLAADPRYANVRADDSYSPAWSPFRMGATLYDGSTSRDEVIAFTGLWSDPRAGATTSACVSSEPQVWLLGYAPVTYWAEDRLISELRVVPAPGYQIVVMTGTIRPRLVVADNMKVTRPPQRCPRRRNRSDSSSRKNVSRARRHTQKGRCRARRAGSSRARTQAQPSSRPS